MQLYILVPTLVISYVKMIKFVRLCLTHIDDYMYHERKITPNAVSKGAKLGGGSQPPLNFREGGSTPPDFEKKNSHIGPFLIV